MQDTFSFNIYGLMLYEKQKIRRYVYMENHNSYQVGSW